jgi:hypothetical protein
MSLSVGEGNVKNILFTHHKVAYICRSDKNPYHPLPKLTNVDHVTYI